MIQTEPFKLGPSNLVHIFLMTRGGKLLILRSGSKVKVTYWTLLLSLVNKIKPFYIAIANPLKFSRRACFATFALLLLIVWVLLGSKYKHLHSCTHQHCIISYWTVLMHVVCNNFLVCTNSACLSRLLVKNLDTKVTDETLQLCLMGCTRIPKVKDHSQCLFPS